jgi:hypothetical protein
MAAAKSFASREEKVFLENRSETIIVLIFISP